MIAITSECEFEFHHRSLVIFSLSKVFWSAKLPVVCGQCRRALAKQLWLPFSAMRTDLSFNRRHEREMIVIEVLCASIMPSDRSRSILGARSNRAICKQEKATRDVSPLLVTARRPDTCLCYLLSKQWRASWCRHSADPRARITISSILSSHLSLAGHLGRARA